MKRALQYLKDHSWLRPADVAPIFRVEYNELWRRLKNPNIGYRKDNHRPFLLNDSEIRSVESYIRTQYYAGFSADKEMIIGAV
jgi:hypothetical protein